MRQAYERTLRDFELYVRSGAFAADAAAGALPPHGSAETLAQQRAAHAVAAKQHAALVSARGHAAATAHQAAGQPRYFAFVPYAPWQVFGTPAQAAQAARGPGVGITGSPVSQKTLADSPVQQATAQQRAPLHGGARSHALAPGAGVVSQMQAPAPAAAPNGADTHRPANGADAVGRPVWRKWEGHGWFEAIVTSYKPDRGPGGEHTIVFERDTARELTERMDALNPPVPLCWVNPAYLGR